MASLSDLIHDGKDGDLEQTSSFGLRTRVVHTRPSGSGFLSVRLTDGTNFYTAGGSLASTSSVNQGAAAFLVDAWPVKVTDGTSVLGVAGAPWNVFGLITASQGPPAADVAPWKFVWVSGGVAVGTQANPAFVSGNVRLTEGVVATVVSGSVSGLLVGGVPVSTENKIPVTGSVAIAQLGQLDVRGNLTGAQGSAGPIGSPWFTSWVSGGAYVGTSMNPVVVTGSVGLTSAVAVVGQVNVQGNVTASATVVSGSVVGLLVGGQALSYVNPFPTSVSGNLSFAALNPDFRIQKRYDLGILVSDPTYVGFATNGSSTGSAVWTIKRTTKDTSGNPTADQWTAVGTAVWSNRTTETYT